MKLVKTAIAAVTALCFSTAASAHTIRGWFDVINVGMVDVAYGWICDYWNPYQTPLGATLVVYTGGPAGGGGSFYFETALNQNSWYGYRPDAASQCNGYSYSGFSLAGWFAPGPMHLYFRDQTGALNELPGSPKTCSGPGLCY